MPVPFTRVTVAGFKSIKHEQSIEIWPLTILAGANSSGKSSIIQPLLLLKQTIESPFAPSGLRIDGPNLRFSGASEILSHGGRQYRISLDRSTGSGISAVYSLRGASLVVRQTTYRRDDGRCVTLHDRMSSEDIASALREWLEDCRKVTNLGSFDSSSIQPASSQNGWRVDSKFGFLFAFGYGAAAGWPELAIFAESLGGILHVQGLRGSRETYPVTATAEEFPGTFEDYTASIVWEWQTKRDKRLRDLNQDLQRIGLATAVEARHVHDAAFELRVALQPASRPSFRTVDAGFGVSAILPVLVALRTAEKGQMVYLDEPDAHLHPRAQVGLAEVLGEAATRGVQVVVETHSPLLITSVQTLVAEGRLPAALVKLHWFTRNPKTGWTSVRSAELDKAGAFGDWPSDFDQISLETDDRYLTAAGKASRRR